MHIKQVIIRNFKSYKDQSDFTPFSPKNNVVVGRNGSGKSNFFHAIQFVLSDLYSNLRPEEKQALLHEGASGETVMQAYVEIVFDNRDGRIPIDKEEVTLRRTIGLKKDEYYLDKKHVSKHDVINLLESAGFSRSNPYYIVQQGKVNAIAIMKDSERLELLKEVAGTHVYDERRTESEKIMAESKGRREKIDELLTYINERLAELETEKDELREYQTLDKERRSLEYTLYDKDLQEALAKLEKLDAKRSTESTKGSDVHNRATAARAKLKTREKDLKNASMEVLRLTKEKEAIEAEQHEILKRRAKLELEVTDFKAKSKNKDESRKQAEADLKSVERERTKAEAELEVVRPEYAALIEEEREVRQKVAEHEQRLAQLFAKQGRAAQFANKAARDKWLREEIKAVEKALGAKREQIASIESDLKKLKADLASDTKELAEKQAQYDKRKPQLEAAMQAAADRKKERDEEANRRKEQWREESEHDAKVQSCRNELVKYERQLQSSVSKVVAAGLAAVRRIATEHNIAGVHGPLIELFEVADKFATAVEVTAATALFYVVVDSDDTASEILKYLNEDNVGRVTFMPLNRLNPREPEAVTTPDALPLLKHIKYNPMFHKAMAHVFGKTLLCRTLELATSLAKTYNRNCVTLDGDQINKRGSMTGGFLDTRASRLEAMRNVKKWRAQLDELEKASGKLKEQITETDAKITRVMGELQKEEEKKDQTRNIMDQLQLDIRAAQQRAEGRHQAVDAKDKALAELRLSLTQLEASEISLNDELKSDLTDKLNAKEQREQTKLNEELTELHRQVIATSIRRSEKEARKATLENQLSSNFNKRRAQLQEALARVQVAEDHTQLEAAEVELRLTNDSLNATNARAKELDGGIAAHSSHVADLHKLIDEAKAEENQTQKDIQGAVKTMEKILNKRSLLLQQRDECLRKLKDLGAPPADAFEKHQRTERGRLLDALHKTNEKLKKYSHVNKKALDQYVTFTDQRQALVKRKEELDAGQSSIGELIDALDQRKDEAIERTFKGVAKHFSEVFEDLVPGGKASLVMMVRKSAEGGAAVEETSRIRQYSGVAIKVAFTAGEETRMIQQLSGGQKSLVALAFIFAIQRCDRAPFYLFDEIDSALDATYRAAVARLVEREAKSCQIIAITFRPELVQVAKQTYAVTAQHKQSKVVTVDKDQAMEIIAENEPEEQK